MTTTLLEPDFIEFKFASIEIAEEAKRAFPISAISMGPSYLVRVHEVELVGERIRANIVRLGLTCTEEPCDLMEEDIRDDFEKDEMEPDEYDGGDDDFRPEAFDEQDMG